MDLKRNGSALLKCHQALCFLHYMINYSVKDQQPSVSRDALMQLFEADTDINYLFPVLRLLDVPILT